MKTTKQITLISSSHEELGELNSNELYKILLGIKPEIIFEELFFTRSRKNIYKYNIDKTVETITINKFTYEHKVIHVPVDFDYSYIINDVNIMYDKLNKIIDEKYKGHNQKKSYLISKYGFKCLNSDKFECIVDELKTIEKEIIIELNDDKLTNTFNQWEIINKIREDEIVKNVFKYSKENDYDDAVLIFGVAHKKSILQNIRNYSNEYNLKMNWKLYGFEYYNIFDS
jgi:hypothetical protein